MSSPYRIILTPAAQRQLRGLPPSVGARVRPTILALADEPRPVGARRLAGHDLWRIRVAEYRVVYRIVDADRTVTIARVARRSESTYRRL